ncbi:MAG: fimbrillin family protein [Alistipes finegoldii]
MKKTLLFSSRSLLTATLFFCAASVVSCQKEETAGAAPSCAAIRLTAEPAELVRTKSETDVAYASRFVEGDAIGLFAVIRTDAETQAYPAASGNYIQNAKFVRQADGSWREEGSKSYYMEQGQVMDLYAYYPYAENADPTALVYDASVAEADFMTARTPGFSERDGEIRLVFRHKLALAEAFVADADKLADYAVTVQDVRTKAVFSLAAAAQDAEMQSVDAKTASVAMTRCGNAFRAYLPAQEIAEGKALLKVEGNGFAAFDYTHPGKTSLAANQVRKLLVTPAFANPELLPNCYVVSPGETLYIPVSKAFGVWGKNDVLAGEGAGMLGAMGARVVWEDVRYLLNGDGNCYWSWHIWVTEYDPSQPAGQQTVGGNVFMDRNLGATSLVKGPQSAGCFYQWGRKDPFQGPYTWMMFLNGNAGWSNDGIGKFMTLRGFASSNVPSENLVASVQQPYRYIVGISGTQDWLSPDVGGEAYRWSNADGTKGVFDPCPEGWRVPVSGAGAASAWADLNGVWDAERTGCVFAEGNGYYPAAGYINIMSASGSGGGAEAGTSGYCWSASSAGRNGYALTYSVSAIKTEAELTKAWACPVRCVKDVK